MILPKVTVTQRRLVDGIMVNNGHLKVIPKDTPVPSEDTLNQVRNMVKNNRSIRHLFIEALSRQGINLDIIAQRINSLSIAERIQFFSCDGIVTDERTVPDNTTRHNATALLMRCLGLDAQKIEMEHSIGRGQSDMDNMTDEQLDDIISNADTANNENIDREVINFKRFDSSKVSMDRTSIENTNEIKLIENNIHKNNGDNGNGDNKHRKTLLPINRRAMTHSYSRGEGQNREQGKHNE
jgi:hypothetical protein